MKRLALVALMGLSFQDARRDLSKEFKVATLGDQEKKVQVYWSQDGTAVWTQIWTPSGRQVIVFNGKRSPEYDTISWATTTEPLSVPAYVAWRASENPFFVLGDRATRLKENTSAVRYDVAAKKVGFGVIQGKDIWWRVQDIP